MLALLRNFSIDKNSPKIQSRGLLQPLGFSFGINPSTTMTKTTKDALAVPAYYACLKVRSETVASIPLNLYEKTGDSRKPIFDPAITPLLTTKANEYTKAYNWKRQMMFDHDHYGNAYSIIERDGRDNPVALHHTRNLFPFVDDGRLFYYTFGSDDEDGKIYFPQDVIHFANIGDNPILGWGLLELHAQTLGKTTAAQKYLNNIYTSGMYLGGVIEYPEGVSMTTSELKELGETATEVYAGLEKAGKLMAIDRGGKYKKFDNTLSLQSSQYIESENLTVDQICWITGVPPAKIGHLYKSNYNSQEHQETDFMRNLMPAMINLEEELRVKLTKERDKNSRVVKFKVNAIMRADIQTQKEFFTDMVNAGLFNRDEVRALYDLDKIPGGDIFTVMGNNLVPLDQLREFVNQNNNHGNNN